MLTAVARDQSVQSKVADSSCRWNLGAFFQICYTSQIKTRKNCEEIVCLTPAGSQIYLGYKEHDLITCESKAHVVVSHGI